jgi:hypothetical protein
MTTVLIPPVLNGAGNPVTATASVRLILADGTPVIGFTDAGLVSEYDDLTIGAGLELELTPQADISMPGNVATYYLITLTAGRGIITTHLVQVPDSVSPVPLSTLVGADDVTPGDAGAQAISDAVDAGIAAFAAAPVFNPPATATPAENGLVTLALTDDTTLTLSARGSDGVVRFVALTLSEI